MDWANERYVRLYTRDTPEWLCMEWQARALWPLLIRKVDRSGVLANKLGARGVAVLVSLPVEVVEVGLKNLLADGCLQEHHLGFVIPNFIEAQETPHSDAQRQRESRERRRLVTKRDQQSPFVTESHTLSRAVTNGHAASQPVTPSLPILSDPILTERDLAREIPQPGYPTRNGMGPGGEPARIEPPPDAPVQDLEPEPAPVARFDADSPTDRAALALRTYRRVSDERIRIAAELGLEPPLPFPEITPSTRPRTFSDLLDRVREERQRAPLVCDVVVRRLVAQAEVTGSLEWLSGKVFTSGGWTTARDGDGGRKPPQSSSSFVGRVEPHRPEEYPTGDQEL